MCFILGRLSCSLSEGISWRDWRDEEPLPCQEVVACLPSLLCSIQLLAHRSWNQKSSDNRRSCYSALCFLMETPVLTLTRGFVALQPARLQITNATSAIKVTPASSTWSAKQVKMNAFRNEGAKTERHVNQKFGLRGVMCDCEWLFLQTCWATSLQHGLDQGGAALTRRGTCHNLDRPGDPKRER